MVLTDLERQHLEEHLGITLMADHSALAALIGRYHAIRVEASSVPLVYARKAIEYCEFSAWMEVPPLIVRLAENFAIDPRIQEVVSRIQHLAPPRFHQGVSAWETCLLALKLPFLGRPITRTAIKDFFPGAIFGEPGAPPTAYVLVVSGDRHMGKTFTLDYVNYVLSFPGGWDSAWVGYRSQMVASLGPAEILRQLAEQIAPDSPVTIPISEGEEQRARWVINLTKILVDLAASSRRSWVIALDGFSGSDVPLETHEFIQQLVAGLTGTNLGWNVDLNRPPPIRLLLLDYDPPLPGGSGLVRRDVATSVTQDEIREYFRRFAAYKGWPVLADEVLDELVTFVISNVAPGNDWNRDVSQAALWVASKLDAQAPGN